MTGRGRARGKKQASRRKGPHLPAADPLSPTDPDAKVEPPSRSGSPVKAKKPPTRSGSSVKKPRKDCITRVWKMNWLSGFVRMTACGICREPLS